MQSKFTVGSRISAEVASEFNAIITGLQACSTKIESASKFVDFFVHDILDYTVLCKKAQNFTKNLKAFNIKKAVKEIMDIFDDKIKMKGIKMTTKFLGFAESLIVKTDQKRLQQVLLNLVSNAVKFTDRNQSIDVAIEMKTAPMELRIKVTDTGCGIKEEHKSKLF